MLGFHSIVINVSGTALGQLALMLEGVCCLARLERTLHQVQVGTPVRETCHRLQVMTWESSRMKTVPFRTTCCWMGTGCYGQTWLC